MRSSTSNRYYLMAPYIYPKQSVLFKDKRVSLCPLFQTKSIDVLTQKSIRILLIYVQVLLNIMDGVFNPVSLI